jgi:uncharacterized protein YjbI with pentapeptide repeats
MVLACQRRVCANRRGQISGTVLRNANLTGAVLWLAEPLDAHLEHANLQDAKVARAQLSRAASLAGGSHA